MNFDRDGAELCAASLTTATLDSLAASFDDALRGRAGARLTDATGLHQHLEAPNAIAAARLGPGARPVRAMLFDKSPARNWALGWHQDRTIAVREQAETEGYSAWTVKQGIVHVVPPTGLLGRMLTLRLHLDPVDAANAALLIAPGSHRHGLIAEEAVAERVAGSGIETCLAAAGDIWVYASLILHASERSRTNGRRRVLQLFYSADDLPEPLTWLGI